MATKKLFWFLWTIIFITILTSCTIGTNTETLNSNYNGDLEVYFFDVGQGDATLFRGEDFNVLIDAGRHDSDDVVKYLKTMKIKEIDLLIGTHPHADHIGQMSEIINKFSVSEVWLSGSTTPTQTFENLLDTIIKKEINYYEPRAGEEFQVSSLKIKVINPDSLSEDLNNDSISLILQYGDIKFLLTGDVETISEQKIMKRGYDLTANIFQAGHHGSSTSNTPEFLAAINPEVVIYSAGRDNPYGHPHKEVIRRLKDNNIEFYGTDNNGTIRVISDGKTYIIDTSYRIK